MGAGELDTVSSGDLRSSPWECCHMETVETSGPPPDIQCQPTPVCLRTSPIENENNQACGSTPKKHHLTYPPKLRLPCSFYSVNTDWRRTILELSFLLASGMRNYLASKIYHFFSCMYLNSSSFFFILNSSLIIDPAHLPQSLFHLFSSCSS